MLTNNKSWIKFNKEKLDNIKFSLFRVEVSQNVTKWTLNRNQSAPAWIEIEHSLNSFGFGFGNSLHFSKNLIFSVSVSKIKKNENITDYILENI